MYYITAPLFSPKIRQQRRTDIFLLSVCFERRISPISKPYANKKTREMRCFTFTFLSEFANQFSGKSLTKANTLDVDPCSAKVTFRIKWNSFDPFTSHCTLYFRCIFSIRFGFFKAILVRSLTTFS